MAESWRAEAEARVERIIAAADDFGDVANSTADELRDMVQVACEWLRNTRAVLVFADGCVVANGLKNEVYVFGLADLYAADYAPAQEALQRAGCHSRGSFKESNART